MPTNYPYDENVSNYVTAAHTFMYVMYNIAMHLVRGNRSKFFYLQITYIFVFFYLETNFSVKKNCLIVVQTMRHF